KLLKANVGIKVPKNHFCLVQGRSSTPIKFNLMVVPGVVDQDYCGDDDEFTLEVINFGNKIVELPSGTRIAQGIFVKIMKAEFKEVAKMEVKSRGGFGTTGS
ncbi:MAG: dUTP diphosphatase, partial [Patescibacteria group bacterium]